MGAHSMPDKALIRVKTEQRKTSFLSTEWATVVTSGIEPSIYRVQGGRLVQLACCGQITAWWAKPLVRWCFVLNPHRRPRYPKLLWCEKG